MARIVELARSYGRYGYRRITALLHREGWRVNHKKVERIWRQEGLKVPKKQPKRGRLWWNDGSCVRKRAEHRDHVWSYDFVFDRTHDGRPLRMLTMVDEYTRECLTIDVARTVSLGAGVGSFGRALFGTGSSDLSAQRQRQRVHRDCGTGMVGRKWA